MYGLMMDTPLLITSIMQAINPMNPENRADSWEVGIIREFKSNNDRAEIVGERTTDDGEIMFSSRRIVTSEACLQCHGSPENAPQSLIDLYGDSNGFGWLLGETVGSQTVSVPTSFATDKARDSVFTLLISLLGVFFLIFIAVNTILYNSVIVPISRLSRTTDRISLGDSGVEEFPELSSIAFTLFAESSKNTPKTCT